MQGIDKWRDVEGQVISTQMGVISNFTLNMVCSLMDERWTLKGHSVFSPQNSTFDCQSSTFLSKSWLTCIHVSLRWRCDGCPVPQCTLPAPGGSPLPEPLNVAPSLSSRPCEEDSLSLTPVRTLGLPTFFRFHPVNPEHRIPTLTLWNMFVEKDRNGKNWKWTKTSLIYPQKASLEECQRSSVNFLNMPYINDCTYLSQ